MIQKVYHVAPAEKMCDGWNIKAGRSTIVGHADRKEAALDGRYSCREATPSGLGEGLYS